MSEYSQRLRCLYNELAVAVIVLRLADGMLLYFNQRVCDAFSLSREQLDGKTYKQIFQPALIKEYETLQARCADGREHAMIYYWPDNMAWTQTVARNVVWAGQEPAILLSISDITEVACHAYTRMALSDSLLGLPNARKLEADISSLARVEEVGLLYFEVERFEDINELYGWDVGDYILLSIRDWLLSSQRRRAQLYRVNNGFALLGYGVSLKQARQRARQILERFTQPWDISAALGRDFSIFCTIRLGIVFGKYVKNEMRNLLLRTIRATACNAGYAIYDERTDKAAKQQLHLRRTLINCVLNGMQGFSVDYQPIVNSADLRWVGLEALCRWRIPGGRNIACIKVIHMAEQLGLIAQVDDWVRQTAMRDCLALGLHNKNFHLDVNFSPVQKLDDFFADNLLKMMKGSGFPAERLTLEITESSQMLFSEENLHAIAKLREHGVMLSLDDFGTGYSSLENLFSISASMLKTEKIFLHNIEQDVQRQYLLDVLVKMAHHLNMRLVAEGVETTGQMELLQRYGADYMQGYLFSRPLTLAQLKQQLWRFS